MVKKKKKATNNHHNKIKKSNLIPVNYEGDAVKNSYLILEHAYESAEAILKAFDIVRNLRRGGSKGGTTDQEQDILRAMVVMTAAGVESVVKQLIRDSLPILFSWDKVVQAELRKFVERKISNDSNPKESKVFLANIIMAESLRSQCVREYIESLIKESLQSADELIKSARALGVGQDEIKLDAGELKIIFDVRNQIIHELDVKLGAPKRNRRVRRRSSMIYYANYLLNIGEKLLVSVGNRIKTRG